MFLRSNKIAVPQPWTCRWMREQGRQSSPPHPPALSNRATRFQSRMGRTLAVLPWESRFPSLGLRSSHVISDIYSLNVPGGTVFCLLVGWLVFGVFCLFFFSVDNLYWQVFRVQNGDKSRGIGKGVGHGSPSSKWGPITRPVGESTWLWPLWVQHPSENKLPGRRDPYNTWEGNNTPEGTWSVSHPPPPTSPSGLAPAHCTP